ncbi:MAG: sulfotransferase [Streptosporangiaceae bacterium]|nr:sulfotransferase [Streptosporangiaceae bacterium]MBV9853579.1 sulfotransferase [Streptosporangiaceae bacterium]
MAKITSTGRALARTSAEATTTPSRWRVGDPVLVLTYAHSGVARLRRLLGAHPDLACLSGVGIAHLCDQVLNSLGRLGPSVGRSADGVPSALAVAATKSMINTVVGADLVRSGKTRWCDTTPGAAPAVDAFLRCYPETTFISLHRHCASMISAALSASPWGLSNPGFAPFAATHPANNVAALAMYWAAHTEAILTEEAAHPDDCHRLRYEDLTARPGKTASEIYAFLGLDQMSHIFPAHGLFPAHGPGENGADATGTVAEATDDGRQVPADMLGPGLLTMVNDLLSELGYPPIQPAE